MINCIIVEIAYGIVLNMKPMLKILPIVVIMLLVFNYGYVRDTRTCGEKKVTVRATLFGVKVSPINTSLDDCIGGYAKSTRGFILGVSKAYDLSAYPIYKK